MTLREGERVSCSPHPHAERYIPTIFTITISRVLYLKIPLSDTMKPGSQRMPDSSATTG